MKADKKKLEQAIDGLSSAFLWSDSDEGRQFWEDVEAKLMRYAKETEKREDCQREIESLKRRLAELEQRCS